MSLQQTLELVRVHYVFWEHELHRAPRRERKACEFFRKQVHDEVTVLESRVAETAAYLSRLRVPHPRSEERLSTARPATKMVKGLS